MTLTEMFTICESCAYAPCLCGNDPENCAAYVMRNSHPNTPIGKHNRVGGIAQNQEKPYCGTKMEEKNEILAYLL